MQSIHFIGRVLPPVTQITVSFDPVIKWKEVEFNLEMEFRVRIVDSQVNVECHLNEFRPEYLVELHRRALDLCRAQVDLVGFKMGW